MNESPSNQSKTCENCKWSIELQHRFDQMLCLNQKSDFYDSEVEATGSCAEFCQNQSEANSTFSAKD